MILVVNSKPVKSITIPKSVKISAFYFMGKPHIQVSDPRFDLALEDKGFKKVGDSFIHKDEISLASD